MRAFRVELVLLAVALVIVATALPRCSGGPASTAHVVRASWTITPGVVNPDVDQGDIGSTICRRGWTKTVRPPVSYTNALKVRGLRQYGLHGSLSAFQEDHLISLELGGNPTDPRNLWPEPYPRAAQMDQIENQLNSEICDGQLTLVQAQARESQIKHTQG